MSERIITLFGEEIVPEQLKAVGRSRAKKKADKGKPEEVKAENATEQEIVTTQAGTEQLTEIPSGVSADEVPASEAVTEEISDTETEEEQPEKNAKEFELPEDWKGDKRYYSIGEVAALFKVKTSHIRFWTNEFKLNVRTTRKGDRLYTPEQVKELRAIHHLVKGRGFTLTGAKAKLKTQNKRDVETIDLNQALLQLRNKLVIIRNKL
jgi:DNA-binding transcriptional MerR regulator